MKIKEIRFEDASTDWKHLEQVSATASIFQSYDFHRIWMKHFLHRDSAVLGVYEGEGLVGIAPFVEVDGRYEFIVTQNVLGDELVSDYGDIIVKHGKKKQVWSAVIELVKRRKKRLQLDFVRPYVAEALRGKGDLEQIDVAPYLDLPDSWDTYLTSLSRHTRQELRRKMLNAQREDVTFVQNKEISKQSLDMLFSLMKKSSEEKKKFLSRKMQSFFTDLITAFGKQSRVELSFLHLDEKPIAAAVSFVTETEVVLYNSGFDPEFGRLSPGLVLQGYLIQEAMKQRKKRFDFLRGAERYKYDLGGVDQKLYRFLI